MNTTKGFRDCVKNTAIDSFQISAGLGHRAVTSSLPTLVLVVSYYLLATEFCVSSSPSHDAQPRLPAVGLS